MFIVKLYDYSKVSCCMLIVFILSFAVVNYKWGVVAIPVLQYGMYSSVFYTKDTQKVTQIYINDKVLNYADYSVAETDIMTICLDMFISQEKNNDMTYTTMKRILNKAGIGEWMKKQAYTNNITDEYFATWYKELLERITGEKIDKLEVYNQKYLWNGDYLEPIGPHTKITNIAVN